MPDLLTRFVLLADFGEGDDSGCVEWLGKINKRSGYGQFWLNGRTINAHRASYKIFVSDISDELVVEHWCHTSALRQGICAGGPLCMHRRCVNPYHLEAVTQLENNRRANHQANSGSFKLQDTCINGHPLAETRKRFKNGTACVACKRNYNREWMRNSYQSRKVTL